MQIKINTQEILDAIEAAGNQMAYGVMLGLNKTATQAKAELTAEIERSIDKPTPWVVNSLRIRYATKTSLVANVAYKDKNGPDSAKSILAPHAYGGVRAYKAIEVELFKRGLLPAGWNVAPGAAANIDAYGNMMRSQLTQISKVLETLVADGPASNATTKRLAKGSKKKNVYGSEFFYSPPTSSSPGSRLPPGIYQRFATGFGTSIKPILMFVKRSAYKPRFDFDGVVSKVAERELATNVREGLEQAIATALPAAKGRL